MISCCLHFRFLTTALFHRRKMSKSFFQHGRVHNIPRPLLFATHLLSILRHFCNVKRTKNAERIARSLKIILDKNKVIRTRLALNAPDAHTSINKSQKRCTCNKKKNNPSFNTF